MKYIAMMACGFVLLAAPQKKDEAERWLQRAMQTETVDGDLKSAIEQYKKILGKSGAGREVMAKALVRLGMCYERQGSAEARKQYDRAVREFADQSEAVAQARARLAALNGHGSTESTLAARQLWRNQGGQTVPEEISLSADGRSLLLAHWDSGDLAVRDMATGEIKRLGLKKSWAESNDWAQFSAYSPDQRQVAYVWYSDADNTYQLRTIGVESGAKPRVLIKSPHSGYLRPVAWSPDGKAILTQTWNRTDNSVEIAWVSAADGSVRTLKTLAWADVGGVSLSPDGRYIAYDVLERKDGVDRDISILAADGSSETAAVKSPGTDINPVWTPDGSHLVFKSDRSGSLGLYALDIQGGRAQGTPRLVKSNVGRILLCGFTRSGALYYRQPIGEQSVYLAELDSGTGKLRGTPSRLASPYAAMNEMSSLSRDGKYVAYLSTRASADPVSYADGGGPGASTVIVKSLESPVEKSFSTDLDLRDAPVWFPDGRALLLNARRLPKGNGRAFHRLDLDSGRVTTAFDPGRCCMGLFMELSRDGKTVFSGTNSQSVIAVDLETAKVSTLYQTKDRLRAAALSPDGQSIAVLTTQPQPFNVTVLVMDTTSGAVRTLFQSPDLALTGVAWSSDGKALFVRHPKTAPPDDYELWQAPLSGGEPAFTGLHAPGLRGIRGGPNGTLTYTAGLERQAELWGFDNLLPMLKASR